MPAAAHLVVGERGEDLAVRALVREGYAILARRYRSRLGEIDIIARDGDCLVFVEVKARRQEACGNPAEAVTRWKQRRIARMAAAYLARQPIEAAACRFDVVAIVIGEDHPRVEIIRNAFVVDAA
jgi:putative endonuclease